MHELPDTYVTFWRAIIGQALMDAYSLSPVGKKDACNALDFLNKKSKAYHIICYLARLTPNSVDRLKEKYIASLENKRDNKDSLDK